MSIGIKAIAVYQPDEYIDNISQAKQLGSTEDFIINKIGMKYLSRKGSLEDTTDLAKKAVDLLDSNDQLSLQDVECLILITQNPDSKGLPHSSAILHTLHFKFIYNMINGFIYFICFDGSFKICIGIDINFKLLIDAFPIIIHIV